MAAVDLFDQGNWFSAGLQGLHMPVDSVADVGMGVAAYSEYGPNAHLSANMLAGCVLAADATAVMHLSDVNPSENWSSIGLTGMDSPMVVEVESDMGAAAGVMLRGHELLNAEVTVGSVLGVDVVTRCFPAGGYDAITFSPGLAECHSPVDIRACAGSRSLSVVDTDPFQVVLADVSMGTGTGSKGVPVIDGVDCQDCEPACLSLSIQTDAMSAVGLSAVGYGRGQADLSLSGFTALSVDASLVLHPFCCDWESVPLAKPAGHVNAGLWAEAMTSGQVRFQVGEFELDACGCTGIRPVWRSNVAWVGCSGSALYISDPDRVEYGHVQAVSMSDTSASGYSVKWSGVMLTSGVSFNADAIALNWVPVLMRGAAQTVMGIDGVQVGCLEGAGRTLSSLGVSAWVVQWPEVMSRSTVHSNAYPVAEDERVRRISIPRFAARAYSPVNTVDVAPCEQAVFALHDGCLVEDIVKAWVDESGMAEIGHTHDRVTVRSADSGELLFIKVLRASGQVAEFRVKVS